MRIFNSSKKDDTKYDETPYVAAIIAAAGNSTRMGGNRSKQFAAIAGVPVIARTLFAFQSTPIIREIIVSAREEDILEMYDIVKNYEFDKVKYVVKGGSTRQNSVLEAVSHVSDETEFLAVHDGARPLVTPEIIEKTVLDAFKYKAAATGVKVKDTIKKVDDDNFIVETPDRNYMWAVQTPQVFEHSLYMEAVNSAARDGIDLTDDCQLIERIGKKVYMSEGDYSNIKITTPEDIHSAEGIILSREESI